MSQLTNLYYSSKRSFRSTHYKRASHLDKLSDHKPSLVPSLATSTIRDPIQQIPAPGITTASIIRDQ